MAIDTNHPHVYDVVQTSDGRVGIVEGFNSSVITGDRYLVRFGAETFSKWLTSEELTMIQPWHGGAVPHWSELSKFQPLSG